MGRLIIFDMDGTLYDLEDVMDAVFETQVSFLHDRMGWERSKVIQFLAENDIEPHVTRNSKSATELFIRMGFGREEWTEYRQMNFPIEKIDPAKSVEPCLLGRFARLGDTVLLTSNTSQLCKRILARIGITDNQFLKIVCSDTSDAVTPFNKFHEMEKLMGSDVGKSLVSIGDRYQTDIVPALRLGGCGCLVKCRSSLGKICEDMESGQLGSCPEYEYFTEELNK